MQTNEETNTVDLLQLGMNYHQSDNLLEAEKCYREILSIKPHDFDANHLLGVIFHQQGNNKDAIQSIKKSLKTNPKASNALYNLGNIYKDIGNLKAAEKHLKKAIYHCPNNVKAHNNLGLIYYEQKKLKIADIHYSKAIKYDPKFMNAYCNLGNSHKSQGRNSDAINTYKKALAINNNYFETNYNLAFLYADIGDFVESIEKYEHALTLNPTHADTLNNLGNSYIGINNVTEAMKNYRLALKFNSNHIDAHFNLGKALAEEGNTEEAIQHYHAALIINPEYAEVYHQFSMLLRDNTITNEILYNTKTIKIISDCLHRNDLEHQDVFFAATLIIFTHPILKIIQAYIDSDKLPDALLNNIEITKIIQNDLFLILLKKTLVTHQVMEKFLRKLRKDLLYLTYHQPNQLEKFDIYISFIYSLAIQSFWNEYIYYTSPEEQNILAKLRTKIDYLEALHGDTLSIAIIACYIPLEETPLYDIVKVSGLNKRVTPQCLELIKLQIVDKINEKKIAKSIPLLSSVDDETSRKVKLQYEENPYPRWISTYQYKPISLSSFLRHEIYPNLDATLINIDRPEILVAGCGTGRQPIATAEIIKDSNVTAIDLSLSSLAYANRKSKELGLKNIEFVQADILDVKKLNKIFDVIECTGVLHHMLDPISAWQQLTDILKPNGYMKIALYSNIARTPVVAAREYIKKYNFQPTKSGIRECRQEMLSLDNNHIIQKLVEGKDFYSTSALRDLIFHVQEQRFDLLAISTIINSLGLKLLGFSINRSIKNQYLIEFPEDSNAISFENWDRFEKKYPYTFFGMYQIWLQKR